MNRLLALLIVFLGLSSLLLSSSFLPLHMVHGDQMAQSMECCDLSSQARPSSQDTGIFPTIVRTMLPAVLVVLLLLPLATPRSLVAYQSPPLAPQLRRRRQGVLQLE